MEVVPDGMNLPNELEFGDSQQEPNKVGIFTRKQVNRGRLYGPFKGERCSEVINDTYSWQIIGPRGRRLFCVDASDATKGNWMRFVKTAPGRELHNLHPVQHKKKIYYKVIKTIVAGAELLCWYEGATEPSNAYTSEESDLLPMPILEKMDFSGNTAYRAPKRVPSPLQVHPDSLPEGLEPPRISPVYPVCHQGDSLTAAAHGDPAAMISSPAESSLTLETFASHAANDLVAIQAPDVTSTGGDIVANELFVKKKQKNETESVTSSQFTKMKEAIKASEYKKKVRKKPNLKNKTTGHAKHLLQKKGAIKGKKVRDIAEMITELYIIGPESVIKQEDGEDRYKCQKCDKLCKYPVGLKIHLRTYHHYINVHTVGIAKKPWARGIALKREKEKGNPPPPTNIVTKDGSWKSMDCSVVQSALEKLKDSSHNNANEQVIKREESFGRSSPDNSLSFSSQSFQSNKVKREILSSGDVNCNELPPHTLDSSMVLDGVTECTRGEDPVKLKDEENNTIGSLSESEITPVRLRPAEETKFHDEDDKSEVLSSTTPVVDSERESAANRTPKKGNVKDKQQKSPGGIFPKIFACSLCHQAFAYKVWRDRHLRMHSESSSGHNCDVCNLKFFSKKDLVLHRKNHHGIDPKLPGGTEKSPPIVGDSRQREEGKTSSKLDTFRPVSHHSKVRETGKTGNMNLEKLVETLQKIQDKAQSNKKNSVKPQKKKRGRTCLSKGYLCRICGSAFSNPSNRSRHMRVQHGLSARKRVVESRMKEKRPDVVMLKTGTNQENPPNMISVRVPAVSAKKKSSLYSKTKKSLSPSLKHYPSSPRKGAPWKGYCPADIGYWTKIPKIKVKENKVVAHHRNRSKRKSLFPFDPIEYQEFPKTADVSCPWDKVNEPAPFVPKQKDVPPIGLHLMQLQDNMQAAGGHAEINTKGGLHAIDLRVKNITLSKISIPCFQPLDLTHPPPPSRVSDDDEDKKPDVFKLSSRNNEPLEVLSQSVKSFTQWKRAKEVRPRVKITSKMSSKKSLKNKPLINPVEWHFTCNICSSNFMSIRELSQHVVAHAEDYPYKCEFCMHVFMSSEELWDHKESKHSVRKTYVCSVCIQEFAYFSNLEKHQGEAHPGMDCTFNENLCNEVRPQNFTDPTKAFNLRACPSQVTERISSLKEEMNKLSPLIRISGQVKEKDKAPAVSPKKLTPEKGMLFNPQRNHPFEQRRKIGFLSMLSDPRNQKQLGSKVNNVCTKCLLEFKDTSAFHVHIMECANIKEDSSDRDSDSSKPSLVQKTVDKDYKQFPKPSRVLNIKNSAVLKRRGQKRAKPGSIIYDPQKYTRVKSTSAFDDIHACAGCGKKFYFINKLERHMKMCPEREKIVNANKTNVALALRKRPRLNTMRHKCSNCDKQFTYLGSLEKHLLMCTSFDAVSLPPPLPPTTVSSHAADYARNQTSLPNSMPADGMSEVASEHSRGGRQRRKRVTPYWRLAENSL